MTRKTRTITLCVALATFASDARAQRRPSPAPLSVGVLTQDPDGRLSGRALDDVLARSPNVDLRDARAVRAAYDATQPLASGALSGDQARAVALMERASLESLFVVSARGDELVVEVYGPEGRLLVTLTKRSLSPTDAQAKRIIRDAFDAAAPVTLAWRARGGLRAPPTRATPTPADVATEPSAGAARSPDAVAAEEGGAPADVWRLLAGIQTSYIEDGVISARMFGGQVEYAKEPVGGMESDVGLSLSLSVVPPQQDTLLLRVDARALAQALDAAVSPEMVTGAFMAMRNTPLLDPLVITLGPVLGGGIRVRFWDTGVVRGHVVGGLDIAPGYAFGAFWEAKIEATLPLFSSWVISPRFSRRAGLLAVSALDERVLIRDESMLLVGTSF